MDQRDQAALTSKWYKTLNEKLSTATIEMYNQETGEEEEIDVPITFSVCPTCSGRGSHVNPSIDAHGITSDEWDRDWSHEDQENYINGMYDVSCYECQGKRVIATLDEPHTKSEIVKYINNSIREEYEYAKLVESERRYGC